MLTSINRALSRSVAKSNNGLRMGTPTIGSSIVSRSNSTLASPTATANKIIESQDNSSKIKEEGETRILITGGLGQIGTELAAILRKKYGRNNVIVSDVKRATTEFLKTGPYVYLNVLDMNDLNRTVVENGIDWIIHNSSVLSATGERDPQFAIDLNVSGIQNVLELARRFNLRVFAPSSIAAFGPTTPRDDTPDLTIMRPTTIYGVTKVYLELLGLYYYKKYNVDFRSLRYPGIISAETLPGGGTTDYAVEIFYEALKHGRYNCFLSENTALPMMYMPDCLKATQLLLEAPQESLSDQRVYNVTGLSFTPEQLSTQIKKYMPSFEMKYAPDFRQKIADSWPKSLDDSIARKEWGWHHDYDLDAMTVDMLLKLRNKLKAADPNIKLESLSNINLD